MRSTDMPDETPMTPAKARDLWANLRRLVQASPDEELYDAFSRCEPLFDMLMLHECDRKMGAAHV